MASSLHHKPYPETRPLDSTIILFLLQDGIVTGAIYALLGVALVMVFAVSRVIFVPQGEFVAFGAITIASLADGKVPGTVWLTLGLGIAAFAADLIVDRHRLSPRWLSRRLLLDITLPALLLTAAYKLAPLHLPVVAQVVLTLALTIPNGPYLYRLAFRPLSGSSVLVLFIAAIAVHLALTGLGLVVFGPEGYKTDALWDASFDLGPLPVSGQNILVVASALALMAALWLFSRCLAPARRCVPSRSIGSGRGSSAFRRRRPDSWHSGSRQPSARSPASSRFRRRPSSTIPAS